MMTKATLAERKKRVIEAAQRLRWWIEQAKHHRQMRAVFRDKSASLFLQHEGSLKESLKGAHSARARLVDWAMRLPAQ